ncbi:MAG: FG-GAP-like repeat-containing protein [Deltaproteobacteria bacterium]
MNTLHRHLTLTALLCAACGPEATIEHQSSQAALQNAFGDYDDQNRSAAVWLNGCSGTLVAPDIVLTAGHCLTGADWNDDPVVGIGRWRAMLPQTVRVGVDPTAPLFQTQANWHNAAGFDDIALILLDERVPSNLVRPARIMTKSELDRFGGMSGKTFYSAGYGSECRGWLSARAYGWVEFLGGTPRGANSFAAKLFEVGGLQPRYEGGDSGSGLLWWSPENALYVTGVFVGYSGGTGCSSTARETGHFIATYAEGDSTRPDISAWLTAEVTSSLRRNRFAPDIADRWHDYFCVGNEICDTGDFDGDGRDDIITFTRGGAANVYVGKSYGYRTSSNNASIPQAGRGFESSLWHGYFGVNDEQVGVFDIDGDGRDDVFTGSVYSLWVARSTGSSFGGSYVAAGSICHPTTRTCLPGEVRSDAGGDDILSIDRTSGAAALYRSTGTSLAYDAAFDASAVAGYCIGTRYCELADLDGDGDDDLVSIRDDWYGHVDVAYNTGSAFTAPMRWVNYACYRVGTNTRTCRTGDFDGDGAADLMIADHDRAWVHVVRNGDNAIERRWHGQLCGDGHVCRTGDFNGDGKDDLADFTRSATPSTQGDVAVQVSTELD